VGQFFGIPFPITFPMPGGSPDDPGGPSVRELLARVSEEARLAKEAAALLAMREAQARVSVNPNREPSDAARRRTRRKPKGKARARRPRAKPVPVDKARGYWGAAGRALGAVGLLLLPMNSGRRDATGVGPGEIPNDMPARLRPTPAPRPIEVDLRNPMIDLPNVAAPRITPGERTTPRPGERPDTRPGDRPSTQPDSPTRSPRPAEQPRPRTTSPRPAQRPGPQNLPQNYPFPTPLALPRPGAWPSPGPSPFPSAPPRPSPLPRPSPRPGLESLPRPGPFGFLTPLQQPLPQPEPDLDKCKCPKPKKKRKKKDAKDREQCKRYIVTQLRRGSTRSGVRSIPCQ